MINKKTVLVLGAGASKDYKFPSGAELIIEICDLFNGAHTNRVKRAIAFLLFLHYNPNASAVSLGDLVEHEDLVTQFATALPIANTASIDDFLHYRSEFALVGKIAIGLAISKHENTNNLLPTTKNSRIDLNKGWYSYLWNKLYTNPHSSDPIQDLSESNLTIITFNYDRSLEFFLFNASEALFNKPNKSILEIPIHHVYGKLGKLDWEHGDECINGYGELKLEGINSPFHVIDKIGGTQATYQIPDACKENCVNLIKVASSIKTYTEAHTPEQIEAYKKLLSDADKIYFLGFGYHDQNLKALGLDDHLNIPRATKYGTTFGLFTAESIEIYEKLSLIGEISIKSENKSVFHSFEFKELKKLDIKHFFREVAPL